MTTTRPPRPTAIYTGRRVDPGTMPTGEFTYVVIEPTAKGGTGAERRGEKRTRTRLRDGLLNERRVLVNCRILDRSTFGAKIQLDEDHPLPASFVLTDPSTRMRFVATLMWQDGREAGVRLKPIAEPDARSPR